MRIGKIRFGNYDLLASIGLTVLGLNLVACNNARLDEGIAAGPPPSITVATPSDPVESRYPDCGDGNAPCVTWDENRWYLVKGYSPIVMHALVVCGAEDGGPVLPCVGKDQDTDSKWIVFTKEPIS